MYNFGTVRVENIASNGFLLLRGYTLPFTRVYRAVTEQR
jgi:hypothetical protein